MSYLHLEKIIGVGLKNVILLFVKYLTDLMYLFGVSPLNKLSLIYREPINYEVLNVNDFHLFYTLGSLAFLFFAIIAATLLFGHHRLLPADMWVTNFLRRGTGQSTRFFQAVDRIGSIPNLIIFVTAIVLYLYFNGYQLLAWWLSINVTIIAVVLNPLLKLIFHRHRPAVPRLAKSFGYSFPSGHSSGSMIIFGTLIMMQPLLGFSLLNVIIGTLIGGTLIMIIGISRVYLGVHYASDVLAGFLLGLGCLLFSYPLIWVYH